VLISFRRIKYAGLGLLLNSSFYSYDGNIIAQRRIESIIPGEYMLYAVIQHFLGKCIRQHAGYSYGNKQYRCDHQADYLFFLHILSLIFYLRSSIPMPSSSFRILSIASATSASSSVLSLARNTMEYATDL